MLDDLLFLPFTIWSNVPESLHFCIYPIGSWICVLICGLILLISHYRFEKLFSRGFWLVGLILFAGSYILFFIIAVIMYACSGGEIIEGENATGVVFFQLLFGSYLFYFTIAYLISFICRLIKSGRNKSKKERGDDSCQ